MDSPMTARRAYTVEGLAHVWECSSRTIYEMIEGGELRAFTIGKRGLRIAITEVERWEREQSGPRDTGRETARSDGGDSGQLPISQLKALASARG